MPSTGSLFKFADVTFRASSLLSVFNSGASAVTVTEKFDPAVADAGVAVITSLLGRLVTLMLGELTNAVNALDDADVDFSRVAHDCAPVDAVAVAPDPVPALLPYTTLIVPPPANVTPVTVTT